MKYQVITSDAKYQAEFFYHYKQIGEYRIKALHISVPLSELIFKKYLGV